MNRNKKVNYKHKQCEISIEKGLRYYNDYKNKKKLRKAKEFFKQALKYEPSNTRALELMGDIIGDIGSYKEAMKYYNKAIRIEPNNYEIYFSKANTYSGESMFRMAEKYSLIALKKYHKMNEKNLVMLWLIYDILINSLIYRDQHEKAKRVLNKGLKESNNREYIKDLKDGFISSMKGYNKQRDKRKYNK